MEIIDYNTVTGWAYAVNGVTGNLTAIPMKNKNAVDKIALLDGKNINIKSVPFGKHSEDGHAAASDASSGGCPAVRG